MSHFQGFFKGSVKNPILAPKSEEMQREAQTNKEQAQNHGYLEENREGKIGGFVLYQMIKISFEDSALIKVFLLVWGA